MCVYVCLCPYNLGLSDQLKWLVVSLLQHPHLFFTPLLVLYFLNQHKKSSTLLTKHKHVGNVYGPRTNYLTLKHLLRMHNTISIIKHKHSTTLYIYLTLLFLTLEMLLCYPLAYVFLCYSTVHTI